MHRNNSCDEPPCYRDLMIATIFRSSGEETEGARVPGNEHWYCRTIAVHRQKPGRGTSTNAAIQSGVKETIKRSSAEGTWTHFGNSSTNDPPEHEPIAVPPGGLPLRQPNMWFYPTGNRSHVPMLIPPSDPR